MRLQRTRIHDMETGEKKIQIKKQWNESTIRLWNITHVQKVGIFNNRGSDIFPIGLYSNYKKRRVHKN